MTDPLVCIIVLGWSAEPFIHPCLAALRAQTYGAREVIVVDNGSPDRTADIVARDFPEVRLIRTGRNLGVAAGNNIGLRAATGEIRVLVNADVEVRPTWLEHLVRAMLADSSIGIAGAKLLYPDGTIQFAGGRIDPPQGYTYHLGWHEPDRGQWDAGGDVDFVTGASLAIRREVLDRIGYEDEKFFPIDYEDPDMSYRTRAAGYRVVVVPQAVAVHHESSAAHTIDIGRVLPLEGGRLRFVCKHWPAERLCQELLPAELEYLHGGSLLTRQLLQWVYLKMLREIDDLAGWRERLGVGERAESLQVLPELLTQLRQACLPGVNSAARSRVADILQAWSPAGMAGRAAGRPGDESGVSDSQILSLALYRLNVRVEPHQPIGWPHLPPGLWPKLAAILKKLVRRGLSWYINPIVEQQNEVNAALLHAAETLAREVARLEARSDPAVADPSCRGDPDRREWSPSTPDREP